MFNNLFKKKDEFELFLEESDLKNIFNDLNLEDKQKFKSVCYVSFTVNSDEKISAGNLTSIRDKNKLIWVIPSNLIYRKEYELALKILNYGISDEADKVDKAQYNINYALVYEKLKDAEKCNYHCWEAIQLAHGGDYAYKRLLINFTKAKEYEKALEVCNIISNSKNIFHENTWKSLNEYSTKKKDFVLKQLKKQ